MTETEQYFNLVEMTKEGTQLRTIAVIFENNISNPISKRDIEKEYTARTMASKISFPLTFTSMEHLIASLDYAPGDVQRQLRTFHDKFKRYGLVREGEGDSIKYIWTPKKKSELDTIVRPALRNIFKTDLERDAFVQSKEDKCELCEISSKEERLAVDHWRAHSVYNVDEQGIAVLLCEKCNNIHHNYDASKCIVNNKDNIKYIKNWIKTEKKVREMGYLPNEEDLKTQGENIQKVNEYYETMHPLAPEFWEGLVEKVKTD
jgi:hypothetical protein